MSLISDTVMELSRPRISVSMIVGNEAIHLGRLLPSVAGFADEIIVVDTGSTDGTRQIAQDYGARVFDFVWCDDFAKARNEALRHCTGEFVMWLDADDLIEAASIVALKQFFSQPIAWDVLYLPYYYTYSPERKTKGQRKMPPRAWRNGLGIRWACAIHEYLVYPHGVRKARHVDGIEVLHYPLRPPSGSSERNLRILKREWRAPGGQRDVHILWHMAKEYSHLGNPQQASYFFEQALLYDDRRDLFNLSRRYVGLARQYRLLGDGFGALQAASYAALAYPDWREPFCEMAHNFAGHGRGEITAALLRLAQRIPRHDRHVELAELYVEEGFAHFRQKLQDVSDRSSEPAPGQVALSEERFCLVAGGDVSLARQLPGLVEKQGAAWPLAPIRNRLRSADIALVNLESVVSTTGSFFNKGERRPFYFRSRPEMLDVLVEAGVSVVTLANNHSMDFGPEALDQELEILDSCGLAHCGAGRDGFGAAQPVFVKAGELIVAIVGVETETLSVELPALAARFGATGIHHVAVERFLTAMAASIGLARCHADVVVVSPHWGGNWKEQPSEARRGLARELIDLGADAILGHSAHILQGIEVYKGCPIVYDMGSILFDRVKENRLRHAALFELVGSRQGFVQLTLTPLYLGAGRARIAGPEHAGPIRTLIETLSAELDPSLRFRQQGEDLVLDLVPQRQAYPRSNPSPRQVWDRSRIRPVSSFYRSLKSNVVTSATPAAVRWPLPGHLGTVCAVEGVRIPAEVRPGRGFVCEVFFRSEPASADWEATLTGWNARGEVVFTDTHPVADGAWPPPRWNRGDVVCDRFVSRPPLLTEDAYVLTWKLVDRETGTVLPVQDPGSSEVWQGELRVGELRVHRQAPPGVAGLMG